jgi:voltage-gated potassium channel
VAERTTMTEPTSPHEPSGVPLPAALASDELKGTGYELFMLLVSLLTIVNTMIVVLPFGGSGQQVALVCDVVVAPLFLFDFLYRLASAPSRRTYFLRQFGWADMLASIPVLGIFRLFRVIWVVRLLRPYGLNQIAIDLDRDRARATFLFTIFMVLLVVEVAGIAILAVESKDPAGNIKTASDAVWWGFVTITTVGYGDYYPVSNAGRVIGTFLLFGGIALFSVLTGFIANAFLAPRAAGRRLRRREQSSLASDVDELRSMLIEQEERAAAIRRKLDEIERRARERVTRGTES